MNFNSLQKLDIKQKIISRILFGIIIIGILFYFLALPLIKKTKELKNEIIIKKIELEDNLFKERNMVGLNTQIKNMEPRLLEINKMFVNPDRELEFITALEGIANRNKINQKISISPISAPENNEISIQPLTLEVTGEFRYTIDYLASLEALNYYIDIEKINFSRNEVNIKKTNTENIEIEELKTVKLTIQANTFWKKYEETE